MPGGRSRRGGVRSGTPGAAYGQRTDLNERRVLPLPQPTGLPYGERKDLQDQARAVPLTGPAPAQASPTTPSAASPAAPASPPSPLTPLNAPSQRPNEPVTAGLPMGAGPGPEALNLGSQTADQLRALYTLDPNEDIRELIELYDSGGF